MKGDSINMATRDVTSKRVGHIAARSCVAIPPEASARALRDRLLFNAPRSVVPNAGNVNNKHPPSKHRRGIYNRAKLATRPAQSQRKMACAPQNFIRGFRPHVTLLHPVQRKPTPILEYY